MPTARIQTNFFLVCYKKQGQTSSEVWIFFGGEGIKYEPLFEQPSSPLTIKLYEWSPCPLLSCSRLPFPWIIDYLALNQLTLSFLSIVLFPSKLDVAQSEARMLQRWDKMLNLGSTHEIVQKTNAICQISKMLVCQSYIIFKFPLCRNVFFISLWLMLNLTAPAN